MSHSRYALAIVLIFLLHTTSPAQTTLGAPLVITIPEVRPGSVVWMKEVPLEPFGINDFKTAGGSVGNKFITFESNKDGSMVLKWRNYVFKRQP